MPKRIVFPKKGRVELQSFDLPSLAEGDIQVRTKFSLMSIGTETTILHQKYDPGTHFDRLFSFPQLKTGVQAVAEVEAAGSAANDFRIGDLIFMRMAHCSHHVIDEKSCSPIPPGIDVKNACWCGLAKTAFRAAWAGQFAHCKSLLVIGAGPVGQMALRWATALDVDERAIVDLSATRLKHASRGGATMTLHGPVAEHAQQIADMRGGDGPPLVVDTTGSPAVFPQALGAVARFGKVILLGDTGYPGQQVLTSDMMVKGLTVQATHDSHNRDGWTPRKIDAYFFDLVTAEEFSLDRLITHEFLPNQCVEAYELASEQRDSAVGVLFDWDGGR